MSAAFPLAAIAIFSIGSQGYELRQVLVRKMTGPDGTVRETREPKTVHLAGDRARLEDQSGEVVIVRLDRGLALELDLLLGSYERKTFRDLRAQWKTLNALLLEQIEGTPPNHPRRAELVDQLTDGPAKWREIWKLPPGPGRERLMARYRLPDDPPKIEIRRTDETKTVAGSECVRYEALENGRPTDWAYVDPRLPFDRRYYEFMELSGWLGPELARALRRVRGLPLETVMRGRGGDEIELRTESIVERELSGSLFEVPEGFVERKPRSSFR